jgi:predicted O-methyltransferase YrrM
MRDLFNLNQQKYLDGLRPEPDVLIKEMELYAVQKKIPILDWKAIEFLELLIKTYRPNRILEIGMAIGYSSIRIARIIQPNCVLHTIEKSKDNLQLAKGFIKTAMLQNKIVIYEGDALKIIPNLKQKYDFIFLDVDKKDYEELLYRSLKILKRNGIIFVDNLLWHGFVASKRIPKKYKKSTLLIRRFNEIFLNSPFLDASIYPIGDGIGVGIRNGKN